MHAHLSFGGEELETLRSGNKETLALGLCNNPPQQNWAVFLCQKYVKSVHKNYSLTKKAIELAECNNLMLQNHVELDKLEKILPEVTVKKKTQIIYD